MQYLILNMCLSTICRFSLQVGVLGHFKIPTWFQPPPFFVLWTCCAYSVMWYNDYVSRHSKWGWVIALRFMHRQTRNRSCSWIKLRWEPKRHLKLIIFLVHFFTKEDDCILKASPSLECRSSFLSQTTQSKTSAVLPLLVSTTSASRSPQPPLRVSTTTEAPNGTLSTGPEVCCWARWW